MAFEEAPKFVTRIASSNVTALQYTSSDGSTFTYSSGGIPQFYAVAGDTGTGKIGDVLLAATSGGKVIGIAQDAPAVGPGQPVRICIQGACKAIAGAAINYDDALMVNASGQVITAATTLANPTVAPVPTNAGSGGNIAAGTYTIAYTFVTPGGETQASPTGATTTSGTTSTITVPAPTLPAGAIGWNVYISAAGVPGTLYKQNGASAISSGAAFVQTAAIATTTATAPGSNTATGASNFLIGRALEAAVQIGDTITVYVETSHGRLALP